jgi:hypothetical protein
VPGPDVRGARLAIIVPLRVLCLVRPSGWDGGPRALPEAMGTPHDSAILVIQNQRVRERKAHS